MSVNERKENHTMSPLLKRASDQSQSDWRPVPEGLWRWLVGVPDLKLSEKYGNYQVKFPLMLTEAERARLTVEYPMDQQTHGEGIQQSWRTSYTVGLSLGYVQRDGQYKSTKLVDFLAACLGTGQTKKFREWIAQGGGPPRPDDLDDQKAELEEIAEWLRWWENLEVYGTIAHREGDGTVFANFSGPLPIGSLPGQRDNDYDALGRGKLKAIIAESGQTREEYAKAALVGQQAGPTPRLDAAHATLKPQERPAQRFTAKGEEVTTWGEDEDPPF